MDGIMKDLVLGALTHIDSLYGGKPKLDHIYCNTLLFLESAPSPNKHDFSLAFHRNAATIKCLCLPVENDLNEWHYFPPDKPMFLIIKTIGVELPLIIVNCFATGMAGGFVTQHTQGSIPNKLAAEEATLWTRMVITWLVPCRVIVASTAAQAIILPHMSDFLLNSKRRLHFVAFTHPAHMLMGNDLPQLRALWNRLIENPEYEITEQELLETAMYEHCDDVDNDV